MAQCRVPSHIHRNARVILPRCPQRLFVITNTPLAIRGESAALGHFSVSIFLDKQTIKN